MRSRFFLSSTLLLTALLLGCGTMPTEDEDRLTEKRKSTGKGSVVLGMGEDAALAMGVKKRSRILFRRHVFSVEIFGRGGPYSFNYDYALAREVSIGTGFSVFTMNDNWGMTLPLYANYYPVGVFHRLLITGGVTPIIGSGRWDNDFIRGNGAAVPLGVGYEYRGRGGFLFRAVPYLYLGNMRGLWGGLSAGFAF